MTIDTENLKLVAEQAIAGGWKVIHLEPSTFLELLTEIQSLKKDLESYMQACNYEVNRSAGVDDVVTAAKAWSVCDDPTGWFNTNLIRAVKALGE